MKIRLKPSIAKDGYYFAAFFVGIAVLSHQFLAARLAVPFLVLAMFCLYFFRDPQRVVATHPDTIVSAADGKIKSIEEFYEPAFLKEPAIRIVTVLSLFNVHINRAPIEGTVMYKKYERGKFHSAYIRKAEKNEKNYVGITNDDISVLAVQMVGTIARRIVSWVEEGEQILRGDKIGLIRFGSRTDVIIPKSKIGQILVKKGDKVKAGESILATIKR
ncbi:MAG: phosphatidylserine decarboxylase [archaeon]